MQKNNPAGQVYLIATKMPNDGPYKGGWDARTKPELATLVGWHGKNSRYANDKDALADEINAAFKDAAAGPMKGFLEVSDDPLVSIDYRGNPASSIVDALLTKVIGGNMAKIFSWYDNEWGFSCRMKDLVHYMAAQDRA